MEWEKIAPNFQGDGTLRDIYVLETTASDWQKVWEILREWSPPPSYSVGGVEQAMPLTVNEALSALPTTTALLTVVVNGAHLNCHFFTVEEIEFDLDPSEIKGLSQAEALADFMLLLGKATDRTVILTAENWKEAMIARYESGANGVAWT